MYRLEENQKFGQYQVIRYLGMGTTGASYEAQDTRIERRVLLKLVQPWSPMSDVARRHFFRLMQEIGYFSQPSLTPIFNFGELRGHLYVVRDYARYGSLLGDYGREWLKPPLPLHRAIVLFNQLAQALAYIHQQGYAHGALTFTNIVLQTDPAQDIENMVLRISDIGLAHIVRTVGQAQTTQLPLSAAPEQYKNQVSARSDQYALAVLLYFWLTGRPPFLGMPGEIEQAKRAESYSLMRTHNLQISLEQEIALRRALSAQPESRYASVLDFATAFSGTHQVPATTPPSVRASAAPKPNKRPAIEPRVLAPQVTLQESLVTNETAPVALQPGPLPQREPDVPQPLPSTDPLPAEPPEPEPSPEPPQVEPEVDPVVLPTPAPDIAQPLPDPTPFPFTPGPETQPEPEKENRAQPQMLPTSQAFLAASVLVMTEGNNRKVRFQLKQGETSIGHAGSSDILLDDDEQVSRHHALIDFDSGAFFVCDQRSTHGVRVNGRKLVAEQRYRLRHDDYIEIGHYMLIFSLHEQANEQAQVVTLERELVATERQLAS